MPDDLYWDDTALWSERQSALLRRLAAGERVNDVDWEHVIEEIEDVGRSELRACTSLLSNAIVHLLKVALRPDSDAVPHWRGEVRAFLANARRAFSASMRQKIDLPDLYAEALEIAEAPARSTPPDCPFVVEELLAAHPDVDALIAKLRP
jgi:hypothetical protein